MNGVIVAERKVATDIAQPNYTKKAVLIGLSHKRENGLRRLKEERGVTSH
ncbi:hypothetical protein [Risungbinella massiliensis]|nr:hypothetical protein [Risungbinella massiliensis]